MMFMLLVACCFFAVPLAGTSVIDQWTSFKKKHNKSYQSLEEEILRSTVFHENLKLIEVHNAKHAAGLASYNLDMNNFGDLSIDEVTDQLNGYLGPALNKSRFLFFPGGGDILPPPSVNWVLEGAVTPVKDQGRCGACWAFSATGAMEGQLFIKHGQLIGLSEQQLLDCSGMDCHGGVMKGAFSFAAITGGLATEQMYPYRAKEGQCRPVYNIVGSSISGYVELPPEDEDVLEMAVATVGPISVGISGSSPNFLFYKSGIFTGETCESHRLDHAVLVVGYGTQDGQDFWILKNSWSTIWGEGGYMRLAKNAGNLCGVASAAIFPLL